MEEWEEESRRNDKKTCCSVRVCASQLDILAFLFSEKPRKIAESPRRLFGLVLLQSGRS